MYIPVKDSCTKGSRKWADVYQPEINRNVRTDEVDREVDAGYDLDNRLMTSADRPHRPWLVPGAGTR
jgi:hypothetical protein